MMDNEKNKSQNQSERKWINKDDRQKFAENQMYEKFGELMIQRIKALKEEGEKTGKWDKPWISADIAMPTSIYGKKYNGFNSLMLSFLMIAKDYRIPVFATFDNLQFMGYSRDKDGKFRLGVDKEGNKLQQVYVKKGEKSFPVLLTTVRYYNAEEKKRITSAEYQALSPEEQSKYRKVFGRRTYHVFNVEQTNLSTARPELWQKWNDQYLKPLREKYNQHPDEMYCHEALDRLVKDNLYICPIHLKEGDHSYYHITNNEIVLPLKEQFKNGHHFYGTMLHEMAHATGQKELFDRLKQSRFGDPEYAREELVVELASAFLASKLGMTKGLSDEIREDLEKNNDYYLKNWLDAIHKDPTFLKTVLSDMKKASEFIDHKIEAVIKLIESEKEGKSLSPKELGLGPLQGKDETLLVDDEQEEVVGDEEKKKLMANDMDGDGMIDSSEMSEEREYRTGRHK